MTSHYDEVRQVALRAGLNLGLAAAFAVAGAGTAAAQTIALPGGPLPAGVEPPGCHVSAGGANLTCDSIVDAICFEYEQQQLENPQCDGLFEFDDGQRGSSPVRIRFQQGVPIGIEVDRGPLQQALAQRQRNRAPIGLIVRLHRGQRPVVLGNLLITETSAGETPGSVRFQISEGTAPARRR